MVNTYWETYDGQDTTGFKYIGNDMEKLPIEDVDIEEIERYFHSNYGVDYPIKIFK